jgi:hypothetical protein
MKGKYKFISLKFFLINIPELCHYVVANLKICVVIKTL